MVKSNIVPFYRQLFFSSFVFFWLIKRLTALALTCHRLMKMAANDTYFSPESTNLERSEFRTAKITLYCLIWILSCIGNSLVIIVIIGARDMRTPSNLLILNLALCDFITPALAIPFDFALEEKNYIWPFGPAMCKVLWPFQTASSTSSSLTLAAVSVDRFRTLVTPFARRTTFRQVLLCLFAMHVFSIGVCVPYSLALDYDKSKRSCDENWSNMHYGKAYTVILCLCGYVLPLITMAIAYRLIYRSLRSNLMGLLSMETDPQRPRNVCRSSEESSLIRDSVENQRKEQNIRLAKMFTIVVVVFAISMFPNQVLWIWIDFGHGKSNELFHYVSVVCRLCTYANSVLNPFIYALKSKEFRSGFARIGRASMHPLRKISSETRKFVRKISRSISDAGQRPAVLPQQSSGVTAPAQRFSETFTNGKETLEPRLSNYNMHYKTSELICTINDFSIDLSISVTPSLYEKLEELAETTC